MTEILQMPVRDGLRVAKGLTLPLDACTQTFAILARKGAGKTYLGAVLVEEMVEAHLRVCVLDPMGAFWGLRASANGKGPGLPITILGGEHGDLPLEPTAGRVVADLVVEHAGSLVLDLSAFESNAAQDRFVTEFAERLYRRKAQDRAPLHLMVDEADSFAPQRPVPGQQRLLGALEAIVRRGRIRGLGVTLITQRPAVLNKNVLTQAECLVTLQMTAPQDRAAIDEWVRGNGTKAERDELVASLASLPRGEAWFWSPAWLRTFQCVQVRLRRTFDSSRTPEAGVAPTTPTRLAPVDLEQLRARMAETIERAQADDPTRLRQRVAELERHLAEAHRAVPDVRVERVEVPVLPTAQLDGLRTLVERLRADADETRRALEAVDVQLRRIGVAPADARVAPPPAPTRARDVAPRSLRSPVRPDPDPAAHGLTGPEQRIVDAIGWLEGIGVDAPEQTAVAFLAGYTHGAGAFNNPRGSLRQRGLVEYLPGNRIRLTDRGRAAARVPATALTTAELHDRVLAKLPGPEQRLLRPLLEAYPNALANEDLAHRAGYTAGAGAFNNPKGRLRSLGLIDYPQPGWAVAREVLFLNASAVRS